jgi:hypothetical protein
MEDRVNIVHRSGHIIRVKEIADERLEILWLTEIGAKLFGRFVRVDKGTDDDVWVLEKERDQMSALFSVGECDENDFMRHGRLQTRGTIDHRWRIDGS